MHFRQPQTATAKYCLQKIKLKWLCKSPGQKLKRQSSLLLDEVWEVFLKQPNRPDSGAITLKKYNSHFRNFLNWCKANHPETDKAALVDSEEDYVLPAVARRYRQNPSGVQKDVMKIIRCATGLQTTKNKENTYGKRKLSANAYSLHSFRHTFVSFCANAGVPLAIVAEIVGHGNPAMTKHYRVAWHIELGAFRITSIG